MCINFSNVKTILKKKLINLKFKINNGWALNEQPPLAPSPSLQNQYNPFMEMPRIFIYNKEEDFWFKIN